MSNVFLRNADGEPIKHAQFPQALVSMLPEMSEAELKLYLFLLAEGHRFTAVKFDLSAKEITSATALSADRLTRAKKSLLSRGLIQTTTDAKSRKAIFTLCWPPHVPLPSYKEQVELRHSTVAKEQTPKKAKAYTRNVFQLTANEYRNYFEARLGISLPITDGWVNVLCPFHDDNNASLGIRINSASWLCHMLTCPSRSEERGSHGILAFELRISGKDKTPDNVREAVANIAYYANAGLSSTSGPDWSVRRGYGLPEASYPYISADGELLYTVHRYKGKRFRTSRPFGDGQVVWNRDGIEPILYNLPEVTKAATVIATEGERDSERVGSLRLVDYGGKPVAVTTCPNGCNWLPSYSAHLKGKRVIICPDADSVGRVHANNILESLKGLAKEVRLVEWSVGDFSGSGKDVSDFLNDHTAKELVRKFGTDWIRESE